jgi:hypothetical protein
MSASHIASTRSDCMRAGARLHTSAVHLSSWPTFIKETLVVASRPLLALGTVQMPSFCKSGSQQDSYLVFLFSAFTGRAGSLAFFIYHLYSPFSSLGLQSRSPTFVNFIGQEVHAEQARVLVEHRGKASCSEGACSTGMDLGSKHN